MLGFALLGLLGVGLIVTLNGDDDDSSFASNSDGTDASEVITGDDNDNTIRARDGADLVLAGDGDDRVFAGDNFDPTIPDTPTDVVFGEEGDDFIRGQQGIDVLLGGEGNDTLNGDSGDDVLYGADIVDEDAFAQDIINTGQVAFVPVDLFDVTTDAGEADTLNGGVGSDLIFAGNNDVVDTGSGADAVNLGDWVEPGAPVEIEGFTPSQDVILYSYTGDTPPNVFFAEDDQGNTTLEADGEVIATFPGLDFFDLTRQSEILLVRI